jgi:hypothetical protein
MNVIILGAGASKSYDASPTTLKMPVAKDFFKTFNELDLSANPWVLKGQILMYLRNFHQIEWLDFLSYNVDIEIIHTEVAEKLNELLKKESLNKIEMNSIFSTYMELLFVFSSVINNIQNGPTSITHLNLAKHLSVEDTIITFNWDTLMDRALKEMGKWNTDNGYSVNPSFIYRDNWIATEKSKTRNFPIILKLHGSTNWLTSYIIPEEGKLISLQETRTDDFYIYESTMNPYSTHKGRFMPGYKDFSYGYYPPNLPLMGKKIQEGYSIYRGAVTFDGMPQGTASDIGLVSMPLIIPPIKNKNYLHFNTLFSQLWNHAEKSLILADKIIIIGYSFPITDTQTDLMFRNAFTQRSNMPEIIIVDPFPENIYTRFVLDYGIKEDNIKIHKTYFNSKFKVESLFDEQ